MAPAFGLGRGRGWASAMDLCSSPVAGSRECWSGPGHCEPSAAIWTGVALHLRFPTCKVGIIRLGRLPGQPEPLAKPRPLSQGTWWCRRVGAAPSWAASL